MRIDFLTDLLPPGIPNFLPLQLAEFLKNRGHRVFIRNAATANRIIEGPLGYMPEPDESEDDNSFKTRWARKRLDLVYMMLTAMRDESVVELVGSLEIPAVLDLRSWRLGEDELEKLAVEIADVEHQGIYILVQTEHVATQLRELGLNQVICLDQGVDRRLFHSSRHDERLRDCWQCQPGCPVLGFLPRSTTSRKGIRAGACSFWKP